MATTPARRRPPTRRPRPRPLHQAAPRRRFPGGFWWLCAATGSQLAAAWFTSSLRATVLFALAAFAFGIFTTAVYLKHREGARP